MKLFKKKRKDPKVKLGDIVGTPQNGFRGIWYSCQRTDDEYVYKYSGGLGTYCAKHYPFSAYAKEVNKTFFCYGGSYEDKNNLIHCVAYYDHNTGKVSQPVMLIDKKTSDAHDNPVICIDKKGHIWIFSSAHGVSRPAYIFKSIAPYSIDKFMCMDKTNFSYPQPWVLDDNTIFLIHTKYLQHRRFLHYSIIDSGGKYKEDSKQLLSSMEKGHYQISQSYYNQKGLYQKTATAYNVHPDPNGLNWRTNLYYVETPNAGKDWQNIQGETVSPPFNTCEKGIPILVHDYAKENLLVYLKDITFDMGGNPVILYITSASFKPGPSEVPWTWTIAHWRNNKWGIQKCFTSDSNYDMGSIYVEQDVWRIIGPTGVGPQAYNPGGEVELWESKDLGNSWDKIKILTKNSPKNHTYVRRPVSVHPDFYAFWADGHARAESISSLYYYNMTKDLVIKLPENI